MKLRATLVASRLIFITCFCCCHAVAQTPSRVIRVIPSAETVSMLTETPGGDYLIPESQIFIGGKDGASRWLALLGIAIDTVRNQLAIGVSAQPLQIKFDSTIAKFLPALTLGELSFEPATSGPTDATLLPSARFLVEDERRVHLSFRLTARFRDQTTKRDVTKNYFYGLPDLRPFSGNGGWTENNASLVHEASKTAFERLVDAFARDIAGYFSDALIPEKRRAIRITNATSGSTMTAVLLAETPQTLIVAPMARDYVLYLMVQVFDRTSVRVDNIEK